MLKRILIMIILTPLCACGDGLNYTRAADPGEAVFWGDSITAGCADYFEGLNRAVPGDNSEAMLELVEYYIEIDEPARHHVLIGTNDVYGGIDDTYKYRLNAILALLDGEVTVASVLPTRHPDKNARIVEINAQARALAEHWGHAFRDVYEAFTVDSDGNRDPEGLIHPDYVLSDGIHLTPAGCEKLFKDY
jgi:lysophospholipase L1-like esterase